MKREEKAGLESRGGKKGKQKEGREGGTGTVETILKW